MGGKRNEGGGGVKWVLGRWGRGKQTQAKEERIPIQLPIRY